MALAVLMLLTPYQYSSAALSACRQHRLALELVLPRVKLQARTIVVCSIQH